jgi:hypothetical protein
MRGSGAIKLHWQWPSFNYMVMPDYPLDLSSTERTMLLVKPFQISDRLAFFNFHTAIPPSGRHVFLDMGALQLFHMSRTTECGIDRCA